MTADHDGQTGGEREVRCDHDDTWHYTPVGLGSFGRLCAHRDCKTTGHPSRPVPVPGQAAREAAVEAALLADSPLCTGVAFGIDPSKRAEFWQRVAEVAVAALSAAPGQEQP